MKFCYIKQVKMKNSWMNLLVDNMSYGMLKQRIMSNMKASL